VGFGASLRSASVGPVARRVHAARRLATVAVILVAGCGGSHATRTDRATATAKIDRYA
jgi:hypothetical protein